jgi:hypothetical protein
VSSSTTRRITTVIAIFGFFATPWFLLGAVGEAYVGVHSLFTRHAVRAMEYLGQFLLGILQLIATLGGWYALFAQDVRYKRHCRRGFNRLLDGYGFT